MAEGRADRRFSVHHIFLLRHQPNTLSMLLSCRNVSAMQFSFNNNSVVDIPLSPHNGMLISLNHHNKMRATFCEKEIREIILRLNELLAGPAMNAKYSTVFV